ncbi:N-acyl-D-amino-acid deacylase family protein [Kribbella solani]|uniref:N-acyl-D-amino-acid deacylase family protein n=1 Tax=Kribbella solani TaxID=236067 RepID=UPI0029BC66DC|nr:amidohydrolase family protein [Kribbella solani]MDX2969955.1 amidohydrolase family protein [Kribbella solani]
MRIAVAGGLIADGSGADPVPGTLLIDDDRITAVLPPDAALPGVGEAGAGETGVMLPGAEVIDATGNIVAPGFIDLHSHADFSLSSTPAAETQLAQGVTTLVAGNCGWSPFPITDLETLRAGTAFLDPRHDWSWTDLTGFAATLEPAVNMAFQVGHCTLRIAAMGGAQRPPTPPELRRMQDLLRTAADQGAVGFSTGLIYAPGTYASPAEVAALVATAAECGLLYSSHIRNEGSGLLGALDEAITAARAGGARLEISHLKAVGQANHGLVIAALEHLDQVDDVDLGWDAYPYTATSTTLTTRLPSWALAGGALLDRLADPAERARIAAALRSDALLAPESVVIASLPPGRYEDSRGLNLAEIARADGVDAAEIVLRILENHDAAVSMVNHAMREEDVAAVLEHPRTAVASDGWILSATGPAHPHPRNFGTFPRVLGRYARELGVLGLGDAVRRMTSLPASRLGLADRGVIRPGAIADLVVFDPVRVADRSTYAEPWQLSVGVEHVLVAGQPVLADGVPTGRRPGRVIA